MSVLLQDLVSAQAERTPEAVAVHSGAERTTYAQIERRANQVARVLRDHGCRRGDRVCVAAPVAANTIAAMLGILKADAICVPLNASEPLETLIGSVKVCRPVCVLTVASTAPVVDDLIEAGAIGPDTLLGSLERTSIAGQRFFTSWSIADAMLMSDRAAASRNRATNPATIVFRAADPPRGVVTTHGSLARSVAWAREYFGVAPGDRHAIAPEWATDRAFFGVMAGLAGGATLVPIPTEGQLPRQFVDFLRREGVTLWHATAEKLAGAAAADVVAPADLPSLRNVSWWTVGMSAAVVSYWTRRVGHARFTSLYGAPEAATVTAHRAWRAGAGADSDVPLGGACPGQEIVILNTHEELAAPDTIGDIWIRGVGLSPGYWGDAVATAQAFRSDGPGSDRMWKTGDRGRRAPDGSVYLVRAASAEAWCGAAVSGAGAAALGSGAGA